MAVSIDHLGVGVVAEEARQRVPNVSEGSVLGQIPGAGWTCRP